MSMLESTQKLYGPTDHCQPSSLPGVDRRLGELEKARQPNMCMNYVSISLTLYKLVLL